MTCWCSGRLTLPGAASLGTLGRSGSWQAGEPARLEDEEQRLSMEGASLRREINGVGQLRRLNGDADSWDPHSPSFLQEGSGTFS